MMIQIDRNIAFDKMHNKVNEVDFKILMHE